VIAVVGVVVTDVVGAVDVALVLDVVKRGVDLGCVGVLELQLAKVTVVNRQTIASRRGAMLRDTGL
jgi:hypothetical protein